MQRDGDCLADDRLGQHQSGQALAVERLHARLAIGDPAAIGEKFALLKADTNALAQELSLLAATCRAHAPLAPAAEVESFGALRVPEVVRQAMATRPKPA